MFKSNKHLLTFLLFIVGSFFFISCNRDELKNEDTNSIDYADLDAKIESFASSLKNSLKSEETIEESFYKYFVVKTLNQSSFKSDTNYKITNEPNSVEKVHVELPAHYDNFKSTLILEYYEAMANAYDHEIPSVIAEYQRRLDNTLIPIPFNEHQQIQIILNASKYAVEALEVVYANNKVASKNNTAKGGGFWDCMRKNAGKKIGRGMVWGALTGGAIGGIGGAAGGTILFPGVGTATGAVGGAIFGGAKGSIYGAIGGAIWAAADCLSAMKSEKLKFKVIDFVKGKELTTDFEILKISPDTKIKLVPLK